MSLTNRKPNVKSLARRGRVEALAEAVVFQDLMQDKSGMIIDMGVAVREAAVVALSNMPGERSTQAILSALGDASDRVRSAAVGALQARGEAGHLAETMAWLPRDGGEARRLAMGALFELRKPRSAWHLADALVHQRFNEPVDEGDAALVLALLEVEQRPEAMGEVIELLIGSLASGREIVGDRAEELLVRLAPMSVAPLIRELQEGRSPRHAASALGKAKDVRAVPPLMTAVADHPDAAIRAESCMALGELRDPAAVECLLRATRDPEHVVRARAGMALDRLGAVAVVLGVSALVRPLVADVQGSIEPGADGPRLAEVTSPSTIEPHAAER